MSSLPSSRTGGNAFDEPESVALNWLWLIRVPPQCAALIVGPINPIAASVLETHFTKTYRWPTIAAEKGASSTGRNNPSEGVGVVIVTEPWPAVASQRRVSFLEELFGVIQKDGCLLLLTDDALVETGEGVSAEAALRSIGFSRVHRYLVEPVHATPSSIVPLVPSAVAHSRAASGGLIRVRRRTLKNWLLGRHDARCVGLTAYR